MFLKTILDIKLEFIYITSIQNNNSDEMGFCLIDK